MVVADGEDSEGRAVTNLVGDRASQRVVEEVDLEHLSQLTNSSGDGTSKLVAEQVQNHQVFESTNRLGDNTSKLVFVKHEFDHVGRDPIGGDITSEHVLGEVNVLQGGDRSDVVGDLTSEHVPVEINNDQDARGEDTGGQVTSELVLTHRKSLQLGELIAKASRQGTVEVVLRQDEFFQVGQVDDRVGESTSELVVTQVQ